MRRHIHSVAAELTRLRMLFPVKFDLGLLLVFVFIFGVLLKEGSTLLSFGNGVCGEDIGFIWNAVDPSSPNESLVRSSFAGTSLFLPLVICLVIWQERSYREGCHISSARGLSFFRGILAHILVPVVFIGIAYDVLCLLLFMIAVLRGGLNFEPSMLTVLIPATMVNTVLVMSVALEAAAVYRVTRSATFAGASIVVAFVMSLTLYGTFLQSPQPFYRWIFLFPGPYFGVGCALGYDDMSQLTLLGYGVATCFLSALIYTIASFMLDGVSNDSTN